MFRRMNRWKPEHRKAFITSLPAGALIGLAIGFITNRAAQAWGFLVWVTDRPADAIFWILAGAVVAGSVIYVWRLLQSN
jgi:hypothetical protein